MNFGEIYRTISMKWGRTLKLKFYKIKGELQNTVSETLSENYKFLIENN